MMSPSSALASTPPAGWRVVPFWSLFRREKVTSHPDEQLLSVYRDYGVIPTASRSDNHNKPSEDLSGYQLVTEGSLVVNKMKAWQGSISVSRYRGIVSPAYYVYRNLGCEHDQFLHYLLRSEPYISLYRRISKGMRVGQWDLEHDALRTVPLLLPEISTQKKISAFLDQKIAQIDRLISKKQSLIDALDESTRKIITIAVTTSNDLSAPELKVVNNQQSRLDPVPNNWTQRTMRSSIKSYGSDKNSNAKPTVLSLTKFGVKIKTDLAFGKSTENYVGHQMVYPGQMVFTPRDFDATPILCGVSEHTGCISNLYIVFDVADHINPKFLEYYLWGLKFGYDFFSKLSFGMRFSFNKGQFERIPLIHPDRETQDRIVDELEGKIAAIREVQDKTKASINKLKEYRSSLITAAVTGQIDVTTWKQVADDKCEFAQDLEKEIA